MELVIDSGNTYIKCFIFENNTIVFSKMWAHSEINSCISTIFSYSEITSGIFCSVSESKELYTKIIEKFPCIEFNSTTPIPLTNSYNSPQTLGLDRIAAAVGAEYVLPKTNKLIIDAGTAITIDFVSENQVFEGGNISPGLESRFKSLHDYTGKLPKVNPSELFCLTGKDTTQAIQNGVINGIIFEIDGYILQYKTIFPDIYVFLTGGDTIFFEKFIKKPIFAEINLNAIGLHRILQYNA